MICTPIYSAILMLVYISTSTGVTSVTSFPSTRKKDDRLRSRLDKDLAKPLKPLNILSKLNHTPRRGNWPDAENRDDWWFHPKEIRESSARTMPNQSIFTVRPIETVYSMVNAPAVSCACGTSPKIRAHSILDKALNF